MITAGPAAAVASSSVSPERRPSSAGRSVGGADGPQEHVFSVKDELQDQVEQILVGRHHRGKTTGKFEQRLDTTGAQLVSAGGGDQADRLVEIARLRL